MTAESTAFDVAAAIDAAFPDSASLSAVSDTLARLEAKHEERTKRLAELKNPATLKQEKKVLKQAAKDLTRIDAELEKCDTTTTSTIDGATEAVEQVKALVDEVASLQHAAAYLQLLRDALDHHATAAAAAETNAQDALKPFEALSGTLTRAHALLSGSGSEGGEAGGPGAGGASHLVRYISDLTSGLYETLLGKLSEELKETLNSLGWPKPLNYVDSTFEEGLGKFRSAFSATLSLELSHRLSGRSGAAAEAVEGLQSERLVALDIMLAPIRKSFRFHFFGNKPTNRPDKPEWMYARVLRLVRDHGPFYEQAVQPLVDEAGLVGRDVCREYVDALVRGCALARLRADLPELCGDDYLFGHALAETLAFESTLSNLQAIPRAELGCMALFVSTDKYKERWLEVENKLVDDRVAELLSSPSAWATVGGRTGPAAATQRVRGGGGDGGDGVDDDDDDDGLSAPSCADALMSLLQSLTERYASLPIEHQAEFVDRIQIRVLYTYLYAVEDEVRAVHFDRDMSTGDLTRAVTLVNALFFVETVLRDWGEDLFYLELQYFNETGIELTAAEEANEVVPISDTVFSQVVAHYAAARVSLLENVVISLTNTFRALSYKYRSNGSWWQQQHKAAGDGGDQELIASQFQPVLSPVIGEPITILRSQLTACSAGLGDKSFALLWTTLAMELNHYLAQDVIMRNRFSIAGARQLEVDMQSILLLFTPYTVRAEGYFKDVKDAVSLLNMPSSGAIKLRTRLSEAKSEEERVALTKAARMSRFTPDEVLQVLALRLDIAEGNPAPARGSLFG